MDEMNSLKFYRSFFEAINDLEDEDRLALYDAIMRYQFNGIEPEFKNKYLKAIWITLVPNIESYNKSVVKGQQGGAPVGNQNAKKQLKRNKKQPKTTPLVSKNNPPCLAKTTEEEVEEEVKVEVENKVEDKEEIEAEVDNSADETLAFYLNNINSTPVPREVEILESYRKQLPDNLILYAMEKAVENKARSIAYIKAILNKWLSKGITTLAEAKDEKKETKIIKLDWKGDATDDFF